MKKRIELLEARQQSSKFAPVVIVESKEELADRADIGPATIILYEDIPDALQAKLGRAGAIPGDNSTSSEGK